jgi:hypothetical protein
LETCGLYEALCTPHLLPNTAHLLLFRYVNSGQGRIQCNYYSICSAFNIELNVFPLLLVISRHFASRHAPHLLPNTLHFSRFVQHQLWSGTHPFLLQFCVLRSKYPLDRIFVAVGVMWTIPFALYSTFAAKYSARVPVYVMSTLMEFKSAVITVLHI